MWGYGGVFQKVSGLAFGLHFPICEMGEEWDLDHKEDRGQKGVGEGSDRQ